MRKIIALFLALTMLLSLTACGKQEQSIDLSGKLDKLPTKQEEPEIPGSPAVTESEKPEKTEKPEEPEIIVDPEPSQDLDSYDNPPDHPHEGKDLTVFDGIYRAQLPQGDDEETWVQITGFNDFIMLEYHGILEGSIYRYWAEEFWPGDGWYTNTEKDTVSGKSQLFSSMAQYENYSGLPQNRCITLTDDGVVLNYDDSDAEYYVRDDGFEGGHTDPAGMRERFSEDVHLDFDFQYDAKNVVGTWGYWTGWDAACMTFAEDGTFSLFWKTPGEPIAVYTGAYGFGTNSGNLEIMAERIGYGGYPYYANWEWSLNEWGDLNISDADNILLEGSGYFWPVEEAFFTVLQPDKALGYVVEHFHEQGDYTDQYGLEYSYYYSLPNFYYSKNKDLKEINRQITDFYYPIIEMEKQAMDDGEILTYDLVDWQAAAYNDVLFLHVYAYTYDWEEHSAFYIDLNTMEELTAEEMLQRIGIDKDDFLDAARTRAEKVFVNYFSEIPEEDREDFGYYDCLEQTVSDDFINLDLPIFVDNVGQITVYLRLSSMAGSGIIWMPECIFEPYYGDYEEEAVG